MVVMEEFAIFLPRYFSTPILDIHRVHQRCLLSSVLLRIAAPPLYSIQNLLVASREQGLVLNCCTVKAAAVAQSSGYFRAGSLP